MTQQTPPEGWMEWYRNATPAQKAERATVRAAEQAAQEARRAAEQAEYRAKRVKAMTTEGLQAAVDNGVAEPAGPHPRVARELLRLDTVERRERAYSEAGTLQNLQGGRMSECTNQAVNSLRHLVAAGREADEMYGERTARQYREAQAAESQARLERAAAAAGMTAKG